MVQLAIDTGLRQSDLNGLNSVFSRRPELERVLLFGSRAMGTYKNGSDIDLCLVGESVTYKTQLSLMAALDDLNLPYYIDLLIYHKLNNNELTQHIQRVGIELYKRT